MIFTFIQTVRIILPVYNVVNIYMRSLNANKKRQKFSVKKRPKIVCHFWISHRQTV